MAYDPDAAFSELVKTWREGEAVTKTGVVAEDGNRATFTVSNLHNPVLVRFQAEIDTLPDGHRFLAVELQVWTDAAEDRSFPAVIMSDPDLPMFFDASNAYMEAVFRRIRER